MSYDTTVNDALDPPEARLAARQRSAARLWKIIAAAALAGMVAAVVLGWILLR